MEEGGAMPIFKTGSLLSAPGIKIVIASSLLTSERKLFMGRGLARDLKIKVPGIDKIFGSMILKTVVMGEGMGFWFMKNGESSRSDTGSTKSPTLN
jgi:hypothetical protein